MLITFYDIATSILLCMQLSWQLFQVVTEIQRTCVQFHEQEFVQMPIHYLEQEQLRRWGHMRLLGTLCLEESYCLHHEDPSWIARNMEVVSHVEDTSGDGETQTNGQQ